MLALLLATAAHAEGWSTKPYLRPRIDLMLFDDATGDTSALLDLGAEVGVRYAQNSEAFPTWAGRTRVAGSYGFGLPGVKATDIRLGSFMGPVFKVLSLESGLDVFRNEITIDGAGLDPSFGVDVPLLAMLDLKVPSFWAGIGTAYLFEPERRVDWTETDQFGFGHEFQYLVGAGVRFGIHLSAQYTHRVVATGVEQTFMLGVGI